MLSGVRRIFENLSGFEIRLLRCGDLDGLAGTGIATRRGSTVGDAEGVVHDKCVSRVRQCTTLEKGLSRIIAHDCTAMAYGYRERPVAQPNTNQFFLAATAFFRFRNAI